MSSRANLLSLSYCSAAPFPSENVAAQSDSKGQAGLDETN